MKPRLLLFCLIFLPAIAFCANWKDSPNGKVIVSLIPYKFFVNSIAGETVETEVLVPRGVDPHIFEPGFKNMAFAKEADIWFQIGEPFETKIIKALIAYNPRIQIVDLRKGIHAIYPDKHCDTTNCVDPHIWLSPKEACRQAEIIAVALSNVYPEYAEDYRNALIKLIAKLEFLDRKIADILADKKGKVILTSHPAFAYYCRDYGLRQLTVEMEGKEPSLAAVSKIIDKAKKAGVKTIFVNKRNFGKGAKIVAQKLGLKIAEIDPLAENYPDNLLEITEKIAKG